MPNSVLNELSGLLVRERDVLEQLDRRLEQTDRTDDVEVNGLLDSISSLELHRAITSREVAVEMGLEGEPTLQDLIESAPGEWAAMLATHRRALQTLSDQIQHRLRPAVVHREGNVVTLPAAGRSLQRSLRDFLV